MFAPGRKEETVTVYPADVVLFEGILAFYSQEVRDLFRMKLFVDTDADTRLSRRGRGRNPPHLIRAGDSDQSRTGAGTKLQRAGELFLRSAECH